jgi:periplasmic mercuric ion binding protein
LLFSAETGTVENSTIHLSGLNQHMKNIIISGIWILAAMTAMAFTGDKTIKTTFQASGNCGQCKARIEKALDVKGVRMAEYDIATTTVTIIYNPKQISIERIHALVHEAGHDTQLGKAGDAQYNKLPDCCKYRDGKCHSH